jgi:hypothetical protein
MWQKIINDIPDGSGGAGTTDGSGLLVVNHAGFATAPTVVATITGNNVGFVSVIAGDNTYSTIKTWNSAGVSAALPVAYIVLQ